MIHAYFAKEKAQLDELEAARDEISRQLEELQDEHGGGEGLLSEGLGDNGSINKKAVQKRIKEIGSNAEFADELEMLNRSIALLEKESGFDKDIKERLNQVNQGVLEKYGQLTEEQITDLVVNNKWITSLRTQVDGELLRIQHRLDARVVELDERYEGTLPNLAETVASLSAQVDGHLREMGFSW